MKLFILLSTLLLSVPAVACREWQGTTESRSKLSSDIYYGVVFSTFSEIPTLKAEDVSPNHLPLFLGSVDKTIEVRVYETIKGANTKYIKAKLKWCGGGTAELGEMVLLYKRGERWHAKNPEGYLSATKKALTNSSN